MIETTLNALEQAVTLSINIDRAILAIIVLIFAGIVWNALKSADIV